MSSSNRSATNLMFSWTTKENQAQPPWEILEKILASSADIHVVNLEELLIKIRDRTCQLTCSRQPYGICFMKTSLQKQLACRFRISKKQCALHLLQQAFQLLGKASSAHRTQNLTEVAAHTFIIAFPNRFQSKHAIFLWTAGGAMSGAWPPLRGPRTKFSWQLSTAPWVSMGCFFTCFEHESFFT